MGELARDAARLKAAGAIAHADRRDPPQRSRFGSAVVLSRAHRLRPKFMAEVTYRDAGITDCLDT